MSIDGIRLVRHADLQPDEISAWHGLLAEYAHLRNAFMSESFIAALAHIDSNIRVAVCRTDGRAVAFLPVQKRGDFTGGVGVYEPAGEGMNDCFGLIASPGYKTNIHDWLSRCGINILAFTHLEETQVAHGLVGENPRIGLRTRIHEPAGEYWLRLRNQDKKFVYDTERRQRKLETEHGQLRFELQSSAAHADLDALIELKQAQYLRTGKRGAALFSEANIQLLHTLLDGQAAECSGVLSTLHVASAEGERLVAAHFGLRCYDTLHFWFPVYDADFHTYAPGRILLRHIIESGAMSGVRCIDRGEGDSPAKRDFANEEHRFFSGVWQRPSIASLPARVALSLAWRMGK